MIAEIFGWLGFLCAITLVWPQWWKLFIGHEESSGISVHTYVLILLMQVFFLVKAVGILEPVFIASNSVNLIPNGMILWRLWKGRKRQTYLASCLIERLSGEFK